MAALSLGIHRGFFRRAAPVGLARGQTALINGAGAVRQTDRRTDRHVGRLRRRRGKAALFVQRIVFCSARPQTLPQLIGVASLAWAADSPICSN